ncbi:MAG TPA: site-specific integrase [Acidimicrobiales bacterium]|nr:site-specific integrase [Acidimicrobiales bacterium]
MSGDGTIIKRGNKWSVVLDLGTDETGRRVRKWHSGYATKRDAQRARIELLGRLQQDSYVEPQKMTLRAFLVDEWLPGVRASVRPTTWESYRHNIESYVAPSQLAGTPLQKVTPAAINAFYAYLLESGRKDGRGLSAKSVRNVHGVLHKALRDAVRWGRITRNVADLADPPRWARPEMKVWTAAELRQFLDSVRTDRMYAAYVLSATTGMRRGEVLGLRWADVNLERGTLAIVQARTVVTYRDVTQSEPKTARGRRSVALDPPTVAALRSHRARQAEERLAIGEGWTDTGLVFTRPDGTGIHPHRFTAWFDQASARAGLPRIRLHDARHSYATLALEAGVHPKIVSERLGHATVAITLDTYSHVTPSMQREAAALVAAELFGVSAEPMVAIRLQSEAQPAADSL